MRMAQCVVCAGALRDSCSDEAGGRTCFFSALKRTPFAMCSPHVSHQMLKGTSNLQEAQGAANSQHHCLQTQLTAVGVTPTLGGRGSRPKNAAAFYACTATVGVSCWL